ncbi:MAG: hypothetical protein IJ939_06270, partial [Clostridia bacterium]|nr:hypothetical protein [Clostridia bacterium]
MITIVLGVISAIVILTVFSRYNGENNDNTHTDSLFMTLSHSPLKNAYSTEVKVKEMNNSTVENAKTTENDVKIIPKCRSVKVLFKNGR